MLYYYSIQRFAQFILHFNLNLADRDFPWIQCIPCQDVNSKITMDMDRCVWIRNAKTSSVYTLYLPDVPCGKCGRAVWLIVIIWGILGLWRNGTLNIFLRWLYTDAWAYKCLYRMTRDYPKPWSVPNEICPENTIYINISYVPLNANIIIKARICIQMKLVRKIHRAYMNYMLHAILIIIIHWS